MNFKEIKNADKPVLVDFFAEWCGPCKSLAPILDQVKQQMGDKITIIKVDVDKNPQASAAYNVRGVPTLLLFRKGAIKWRQSGIVSAEHLKFLLENNSE